MPEVLAKLGGIPSKSSVVVNLILGWLGIKGKEQSPNDRDEDRHRMLRAAEQIAASKGVELELPESQEELNRGLDKMSESFEAIRQQLGLSPEDFATLVSSPEYKEQIENNRQYWEYNATAQLRIPLLYLEKNGERLWQEEEPPLEGPANGASEWEDGTAHPFNHFGRWVQHSTFQDWLFPSTPEHKNKHQKHVDFLIEFRKIIEDTTRDIEQRIGDAYALADVDIHKDAVAIFCQGDWLEDYLCYELSQLNGVGPKKARMFYDYGYKTPELLLGSSDDELLRFKGIGKKFLEKLRSENPL